MPTSATQVFSGKRIQPALSGVVALTQSVALPNSIAYARGTILGEAYGTDAIQKFSVSGAPTGGSTILHFGGQNTAAIPYNAEAQDVQAALGALSTIGAGNVVCWGGPLPNSPIYIQFIGALGGAVQPLITSTDSFTGGTTPASTFTTTQVGAAGARGTYKAYSAAATDGSQFPRGILQYDVSTDASGNITLTDISGQAGGEWGQTSKTAPMYISGMFQIEDLPLTGTGALDGNAVRAAGWRMVEGSIALGHGIVALG